MSVSWGLKAVRVEQAPKLDGTLDDPVWQDESHWKTDCAVFSRPYDRDAARGLQPCCAGHRFPHLPQ